MTTKHLRISGQPVTDSNFEPVKVTRKQAESLSRQEQRDFQKMPWGKDAKGFVFEAEQYFNVTVGFGRLKNA